MTKFVRYNKESVEKAIKKDPKIKPKEARLIHSLLKGHSEDKKGLTDKWIMWFQDGGGRTLIEGRKELRKLAKQYDFNADEVIEKGQTQMFDNEKDIVGGVFTESKKESK